MILIINRFMVTVDRRRFYKKNWRDGFHLKEKAKTIYRFGLDVVILPSIVK